MSKDLNCPNCGPDHRLIWKDNGDAVCGTCSGTFHPGVEPKVVAVGEFDELKGKVTKLEANSEKLAAQNAELRELLGQKPAADSSDTEASEEEDL